MTNSNAVVASRGATDNASETSAQTPASTTTRTGGDDANRRWQKTRQPTKMAMEATER